MSSHRPKLALEIWEELIRAQPDDMRLKVQAASCLMRLGRHSEAEQLLEPLLADANVPARAHLLLGIVRHEQGRLTEALDYLNRAEQAEVRSPSLFLRLGEVHMRRRNWDDAERVFQRVLAIDEDSPHGHLGLAMVALRRRDPAVAASEALTAVGLQHHLVAGHFILGVALTRLGDVDRAMLALETCIRMRPDHTRAHRLLSVLYRRQGDFVRAAHHRVASSRRRVPAAGAA
jgi:predicted Zn-dependent protease